MAHQRPQPPAFRAARGSVAMPRGCAVPRARPGHPAAGAIAVGLWLLLAPAQPALAASAGADARSAPRSDAVAAARRVANAFGAAERREHAGGWAVHGDPVPTASLLDRHFVFLLTPADLRQRPPVLRPAIVGPAERARWLDESSLVEALRREHAVANTVEERIALARRAVVVLETGREPVVVSSAGDIPGRDPDAPGDDWAREIAPAAGRAGPDAEVSLYAWNRRGGDVLAYTLRFRDHVPVALERRTVARRIGSYSLRQ